MDASQHRTLADGIRTGRNISSTLVLVEALALMKHVLRAPWTLNRVCDQERISLRSSPTGLLC